MASSSKPWNLVADIGGTNARFGVQNYETSNLSDIKKYSVSEHAQFESALKHLLRDVADLGCWNPVPKAVCLAVACPAEAETVQFTNSPWTIERQAISKLLDGARVDFINDFGAVGYAVTDLKPGDWRQIGQGSATPGTPIAVLGPGTGLGVCSLIPAGAGFQVVQGEGGHVDFAPIDAREIAVLEILSSRFGRVSVERLLSGSGIVNIYQALAQLDKKDPVFETPAEITEAASKGTDTLSVESLQLFCRVLGAVAGNLALTLGAKGGVYIAGGIVPRFVDFFEQSDFRHRFESKGRFSNYLASIPTRLITKDDLGLAGAVKKLNLSEL